LSARGGEDKIAQNRKNVIPDIVVGRLSHPFRKGEKAV
jgi:hypothetical protein